MGFWDRLLGRTPPAAVSVPMPTAAPVQESLFAVGYDPDLNLPATGGGSRYFRPLSKSLEDRDLQPVTQERMIGLAAKLYDVNNLAKRVLELTRDMILGEGVSVVAGLPPDDETGGGATAKEAADDAAQASRDDVQEVIDAHWADPINRWDLRIFDRTLELGLFGEQFWTVQVNDVDGSVRISSIDPSLVKAVHVDPRNPEQPFAVEVVPVDRPLGQVGAADSLYFRLVHVDENLDSPAFGRMVGATEGEPFTIRNRDGSVANQIPFTGSCFYFAVNKLTYSRRGRSDLLPLIDWCDAYDQYLFSEMERSIFLKAFVWDVTIQDADATQIEAMEKKFPNGPAAGAVRFHNQKVEWKAESPDLKAVDSQAFGDMLLSYISVGAGLPKTWLAGVMDVNRATATSLAEPAYKRVSARQRYVKAMIVQLITFVLDQAELAGRLPKRPDRGASPYPVPWTFEVQMPELSQKDLSASAAALQQTAAALTAMLAGDMIDLEVAQQVSVTLLGNLGVEVDMDAMRQRIEQQQEEDAMQPYPAGGPDMGVGGDQQPEDMMMQGASNAARPPRNGTVSQSQTEVAR